MPTSGRCNPNYEEVLEHVIPYLLPFKNAVRTRTLSKMHKNVLYDTRRINVDETEFTLDEQRRKFFIKVIRHFRQNHVGKKIDLLRLRMSHPIVFHEEVESWIAFAIEKNVDHMELDFSKHDEKDEYPPAYTRYYSLSEQLYKFRHHLRSLKLSHIMLDATRCDGVFRSLKSVTIAKVTITQEKIDSLLDNRSLKLSILRLVECKGLLQLTIEDNNVTLRSLTIEDCKDISNGIIVHAMVLKFFKYRGQLMSLDVIRCTKIEKVVIELAEEIPYFKHVDVLPEFLSHMHRARQLVVCSFFLRVLSNRSAAAIKQHLQISAQMKHLVLRGVSLRKEELYGILFLLQSFSLLKSLTVELGEPGCMQGGLTSQTIDHHHTKRPESFPKIRKPPVGVQSHLRNVEIVGFRELEHEMHFVKFLLSNARCLISLKVSIPYGLIPDSGDYDSFSRTVVERLSGLPKASSTLAISRL